MTDHTKTSISPGREKPVRWLGTSLAAVRGFPSRARQITGYELWCVQQGLEPSDWKPMKSIGQGAAEIRIRTRNEYRLIYIAKFPESIYVLHAFEKRTRKTSGKDVRTARVRLGWLMEARAKGEQP